MLVTLSTARFGAARCVLSWYVVRAKDSSTRAAPAGAGLARSSETEAEAGVEPMRRDDDDTRVNGIDAIDGSTAGVVWRHQRRTVDGRCVSLPSSPTLNAGGDEHELGMVKATPDRAHSGCGMHHGTSAHWV